MIAEAWLPVLNRAAPCAQKGGRMKNGARPVRTGQPDCRNTGQKQNTGHGLREESTGIPDKIADNVCPATAGDCAERQSAMLPV
jgi:hypothetical protein